MTLSALASLVCSKVRKTDTDSVAECKLFLRQRLEMIYDAALWKDTVGLVADALEVDTSTNEYRRIVILPDDVASVLGVRWNTETELAPSELAHWLRVDAGGFELTGTPAQFTEIDATGLGWTIQTATLLTFLLTNPADVGTIIQLDGELNGVSQFETLALTAGSTNTVNYWTSVRAISKPVTSGDVLAYQGAHVAHIYSNETVSRFARIQLDRVPDYPATPTPSLYILAKRKLTSFVRDSDAPMIRGANNALIAFAQGDMLERERQYSKAQAKVAEGQALLQLMIDSEQSQSSVVRQIVPMQTIEAGTSADFMFH